MTGFKYVVVALKKGWAVQNSRTMAILSTHMTEREAQRVAKVLNGLA